jgi:hypothetical protein
MNEQEIDLEIERRQKMKQELQEVNLPRAEIGGTYFFVNDFFGISASVDDRTMLDNYRYSSGNYYLTDKAAEKKARHARFEAEVKAYLRALNDGEDYWPKRGEYFYLIDADIDVQMGSWWCAGYTFIAPKEDHLQKAIEKFGEESFDKFFYGEL